MWKGTQTRRGLAAFMLTTAVLLGGCEDDPIDGGEEEPEVGGFIMTSGGDELYRYTDEQATQPDTLFLTSGQTYEVSIEWLDFDGDPTTLEEGLVLEVEIGVAGMLTAATTGDASATLVAATVGAPTLTTMLVRLFHTEEQHDDFTSVFFPVEISP